MLEVAAQLLLTYLLHSSVLLGAVGAAEGWLQRRGLAEFGWRAALIGAWLSSLLALGLALRPNPAPEQPASTLADARGVASPAISPAVIPSIRPATAPARAAPPTAQPSAPLFSALAALTVVWLFVGLLALAQLALQALRLSLHARRLPPWPLPAPGARLHLSPAPSPWAWAGRVGLPAWLLAEPDPALREAVLAHELAHLQRRDPAWRLITQAAARLGWLQPLNRLALRRLDALMEADCDRRAAHATGRPEALADALLRCAEQLRAAPRGPRPALAMLTPETPLLARLRLLLEPTPMSFIASPQARWWMAGALVLCAFALPAALLPEGSLAAVFEETVEDLQHGGPLWVHAEGGNSTLVRTGAPGLTQELRWKGRLQLNDDETAVTQVDGPLRFRERRGDLQREWTLTPSAEGLRAEYRVNGQLQDEPDAQGQAWIRAMLLLAAESTTPPKKRAARVLEREGLPGLGRYLADPTHDHQRRQRIEAAAGLPGVPAALLLEASARFDNDFERRHALEAIAPTLQADAEAWRGWLAQAAAMGNDFELANLLIGNALRLPATLQAAWVTAVSRIDNDYEQRRALEALLRRPDAADWTHSLLLAAQHLQGDHEQQQLLQRLAERLPQPVPQDLGPAIAEAAARIPSDFDRRQALNALLQRQPRDAETLRAVLRAGSGIDNGFERLQLLQALAPLLPADGSLHADYRQVARGLSSHERGQAEQALDR